MTSAVEQGRRLEERIAAYFASHGYATRLNAVLEGRSGGRHEVDVLAEKSDPLTTYRVAIECKAWQSPIEKDVVSKLHYVVSDLGLSKGIVVSLAGCRSGADRTAQDLGIDLWGPDELRRHLGDGATGELTAAPPTGNALVAWGLPVATSIEAARSAAEAAGKGRLHLRTLERLVWFSLLWLPVYCIQLSVAQPEVKRLRTRLRSAAVVNLYEALSGTYLGTASDAQWRELSIDGALALRPSVRDSRVHAAIRKAVESSQRVSSPVALERHAAQLAALGVPVPCAMVSVESTSLVYLPYYAGLLESRSGQRVVAVSATTGTQEDLVSQVLTGNVALLRAHFSR